MQPIKATTSKSTKKSMIRKKIYGCVGGKRMVVKYSVDMEYLKKGDIHRNSKGIYYVIKNGFAVIDPQQPALKGKSILTDSGEAI